MFLGATVGHFALTAYTGNEDEATRHLIRNIFTLLVDNDDYDDPKWIWFDVTDAFSSTLRKHSFQGYMKWPEYSQAVHIQPLTCAPQFKDHQLATQRQTELLKQLARQIQEAENLSSIGI